MNKGEREACEEVIANKLRKLQELQPDIDVYAVENALWDMVTFGISQGKQIARRLIAESM